MPYALGTVTVLALLMTVAMAVVTWRIVQEERRRSVARLAVLTAELKRRGVTHPSEAGARPRSAPGSSPAGFEAGPPAVQASLSDLVLDDYPPETMPAQPELFHTGAAPAADWSHSMAGFGIAAALLAAVVSAVILAGSGDPRDDPAALQIRPPVELIALEHERQDGILAISGIVRNPAEGLDEQQLRVLAVALDTEGVAVARELAPLARAALPAGSESAFAVTLPAERAIRYRISFLADDTTVPHLDRRARLAEAGPESDS